MNKFFAFLGFKFTVVVCSSAYIFYDAENFILKDFSPVKIDSYSLADKAIEKNVGIEKTRTIEVQINGNKFLSSAHSEFLDKWNVAEPLYSVTTGNIFINKTRLCPTKRLSVKGCLWIDPKNNNISIIKSEFFKYEKTN